VYRLTTLAAAAIISWLAAGALAAQPPHRTLARFESEAQLKEWLEAYRKRVRADPQRMPAVIAMETMSAPAAPPAQATAKDEPVARGAAGESVTNVQTAGVDEGGIVKTHGDHLVVLRRGRLFTVSLRDGGLARGFVADAYGAGIDPGGAWYDEMLVDGDTIVVIGYSYQRGGTEVGIFDIDGTGRIAHRATYHLRSNDYYSSRNYASRLVGSKLIFYTPLYLNPGRDPSDSFPAMRRWHGNAGASDFKRIAPATRIYRTDEPIEGYGLTLHTVTVCDLARAAMTCDATGVLGPAGRVFYVSRESVYVWATSGRRSAVFRIPLDGGAPSALKTSGNPIDQMSFLESDDGFLNVLLRARGRGEAMWAAESTSGSTALLRVPLASFGDGRDSAPASAYRRLPSPAGYNVQNRFVGAWLLYGNGSTWGPPNAPRSNALHAVRWAETGTVQTFSLPHGVDRIEAMGRHAVVVGTAGRDLLFSTVRLADEASIPHRLTRENAAQGETRSHGFFYKPDGDDTGLVGLPIVGGGRPGYRQLREGSASVLFLRNDGLMLGEIGELEARAGGSMNDNCRASCVDWYGNARPLFLRGRIFALLGYEIVEGELAGGGIREVRRVGFAPM
jgi:hypothetical protein